MNCAIKIISKTLMTKISHISWGVTTKAFTVIKIIIIKLLLYIILLSDYDKAK